MPNLGQKMYAPQKNFMLPQYRIPQKKRGFLNKALRPRSLRSLAPRPLAVCGLAGIKDPILLIFIKDLKKV